MYVYKHAPSHLSMHLYMLAFISGSIIYVVYINFLQHQVHMNVSIYDIHVYCVCSICRLPDVWEWKPNSLCMLKLLSSL